MEEYINNIERKKRVNSTELRELMDYVTSRTLRNYHELMKIKGVASTVLTCLELTNMGIIRTVTEVMNREPDIRYITPFIDAIYPESIEDSYYAEISPDFMTMTAKKLSTRNVFTDSEGGIYSNIKIDRKAVVLGTTKHPLTIKENEVENMFEPGFPYIIRFEYGDQLPGKEASIKIEVTITSTGDPFILNSIKWLPMPMSGSMCLSSIGYSGAMRLVMNGRRKFEDIENFQMDRTFQGELCFEPITTNMLKFSILTETYSNSLNAIVGGISRIIGELSTYSLESYVGYLISDSTDSSLLFPDGMTRIKTITVNPAYYSKSTDNITIILYDNADEFNKIGSNFIARGKGIIDLTGANITKEKYPNIYILVKLNSVNNTTPVLGNLKIEFE